MDVAFWSLDRGQPPSAPLPAPPHPRMMDSLDLEAGDLGSKHRLGY